MHRSPTEQELMQLGLLQGKVLHETQVNLDETQIINNSELWNHWDDTKPVQPTERLERK